MPRTTNTLLLQGAVIYRFTGEEIARLPYKATKLRGEAGSLQYKSVLNNTFTILEMGGVHQAVTIYGVHASLKLRQVAKVATVINLKLKGEYYEYSCEISPGT